MWRSVSFVVAALVAAIVAPGAAHAAGDDAKAACLAAHEEAQQLRLDGKLIRARGRLVACERAECPAPVRQDCAQWESEVLTAVPTVVFAARDEEGRDLVDVRVTLDGAVVTERLDGKPLDVDPGEHSVRFEAPGLPAAEDHFVARTGEKLREIALTLRAPPHTTVVVPRKTGAPVLAWVLGGIGVAALGGAAALDLVATGDAHDLRANCAPACDPNDVDAVRTKYLLAGISLGVGVVSLAAAAYLFLKPAPAAPPRDSAFFFDVRPSTKGVTGDVGARF